MNRLLFQFAVHACFFPFMSAASEIEVRESEATIEIVAGGQAALTYHKSAVDPPENADPLFRRSGFIHPLRAPSGAVVTGIHPDDHLHHLGLWHAWVRTRHRGRAVDFWNIGDGTGTVRYAGTIAVSTDGGDAAFVVLQEHLALEASGRAETVLREQLSVAFDAVDGAYAIDYDTLQTNVSDAPLELAAYRYGGPVAYRSPLDWDADNSVYLSSEGRGREDGHGTRARWVAMSGPVDGGPVTVAILCHPSNRDAPQRVRIWPDGKVFFNYVPAQQHAFAIGPGEAVSWRYRVIVYDGEPDAERIEKLWADYRG